MPLNAHQKRAIGRFDGLDQPVRRPGDRPQPTAQALDGLVVKRVDAQFALAAEGQYERRARLEGDRMRRHLTRLALAVVDRPGRQILDEAPAAQDVDELLPATDGEDRQLELIGAGPQRELELVKRPVGRAQGRAGRLAVGGRVEIRTPRDEQPVDAPEKIFDRAQTGRDHQRDAARTFDRLWIAEPQRQLGAGGIGLGGRVDVVGRAQLGGRYPDQRHPAMLGVVTFEESGGHGECARRSQDTRAGDDTSVTLPAVCGIAAEVRFDGRPADACALERMSHAMRSRGPDGSGLWAQDSRGLAHRRLRIIDLSERGAQPMSDPELGLTIAFNGCIYNYRELREELAGSGMRFISSSDTEVLLKAYAHWGAGFVEHLVGMFAFVLVEHAGGRVIAGRDRLGIKPLYLSERPGALRMASTLPALLAAGEVDTSIDPVALHHYLSWHSVVPAPRTILAGVRKLDAATLLTIEPDGARSEHRYWEPRYQRPEAERTAEQWVAETRELLGQAVRRRMVADVPVGVLLSGGLDSSLIASLLAHEGQRGLQTFAIGFQGTGELAGDEFEYSDLMARELSLDHHRIEIPTQRLTETLPDAINAMSEPMVSHDAVAFYMLSEEVSRSLTVVQSGQGADEVFAGYHWYPKIAAREASGLEDAVDTYEAAFFDRTDQEIRALVDAEGLPGTAVSREYVSEHFGRDGASDPLDRALRLDQLVMLVEDPVKRLDNMTMAHGLEARVPFLDHELVEHAAACPPELKLAEGGKGTLKRLARGLVPDAVIDRPKGYFPVPALVSLEGPVLSLVTDALTSTRATDRGLWSSDRLEEMLREPNEHLTPSGANQLWQIGLLEIWLQSHGL